MSDAKKVKPSSALAGKIAGFDICRRPVYQTVIGRDQWANDMLKAMASCKMLGVQTFEVDVKYDPAAQRPQQKKPDGESVYGISNMFRVFYTEEAAPWQEKPEEPAPKQHKTGADVLTLYAVVVE